MQKKNIPIPHDYSTSQKADSLAIKLTQTRALLLIGSDVDFSGYHPSVQQDFFGATLEYVEDISCLMEDSTKKS